MSCFPHVPIEHVGDQFYTFQHPAYRCQPAPVGVLTHFVAGKNP
jgi:hypothetical protein